MSFSEQFMGDKPRYKLRMDGTQVQVDIDALESSFMEDASTRKDEVGNREPLAGKGQPSLTHHTISHTEKPGPLGTTVYDVTLTPVSLPTRAELVELMRRAYNRGPIYDSRANEWNMNEALNALIAGGHVKVRVW